LTARRAGRRLSTIALTTVAAVDALSVAYLLVLLAAAATARKPRRDGPPSGVAARFVVIVPAHDEERDIASALASLKAQTYPPGRFVVAVIADNCSDRTAEVARAMGAVVYERVDTQRPGKGHALAWGFGRIREDYPDVDAIAMLDADCEASSNFLQVMSRHVTAGAAGAQATIKIQNPDEAWSAALQAASFGLINEVHARGRQRLNLFWRPQGTGTMLTVGLLDRVPWDAYSPFEDVEYSARLIAAAERFDHAGEAVVTTRAATALQATAEQQQRWESGRWALLAKWFPKHLHEAVRQRDPRRLIAALELVVPAQSRLLVTTITTAIAGRALSLRSVERLAAFSLAGQASYVLGGLFVAGAPPSVFSALLRAPVLAIWKIPLHIRSMAGRGSSRWIRGPRTATQDV
jgi:cellulose synthase/poly-beta-1,6-N-acetylglucosamine synthase-like glycosyltransferase